MKNHFFRAVLVHTIFYFSSVSALPSWLFARQSCDAIACLPDDWWVGPAGLADGIYEWLDGFKTNPPLPEIPPNVPKDGSQVVPAPPILEPDINLDVIAPNQGLEECAPSSPPDSQRDSDSKNPGPCLKATEQLIWPRNCEDTAQNGKTQQMLSVMNAGYRVIVDPMCPVKDGVLFWLADITPEDIDLLKSGGGVGSIVPNVPFRSEVASISPAGEKVPTSRTRSKRATVNVVKQETSDPSLTFLSSPPWKINSESYAYLSKAGEGVRIYDIDTGCNTIESEFGGLSISWIYPATSPREQRDDADVDRGQLPGTCLLSKIAGRYFGVAKRPRLTIVKAKPTISSFMEALLLVFLDLQSLSVTKGWTVVNIAGGFLPPNEPSVDWQQTLERMRVILIDGIVEIHGTVVVCSSGADFVNPNPDTAHYPARLPGIITVGSVRASDPLELSGGGLDELRNGQRYPWSRGRDSVTLNAPGNGLCVFPDHTVRNVQGPSLSSAIVSGLVANFLSLPDLGPYFREQTNTPATVAAYLQRFSYKRFQLQESVWNGLDSEQTRLQYEYWYGDAPSKQLNPLDMQK